MDRCGSRCLERRLQGHPPFAQSGWAGALGNPTPALVSPGRRQPRGPIDWGDLAGGAGYFDQAHFGHEFQAFTGLTPTRYVEVRRRFMREHPGHPLDGRPLPAD
jgi:AraC-like DNA-binding protein